MKDFTDRHPCIGVGDFRENSFGQQKWLKWKFVFSLDQKVSLEATNREIAERKGGERTLLFMEPLPMLSWVEKYRKVQLRLHVTRTFVFGWDNVHLTIVTCF